MDILNSQMSPKITWVNHSGYIISYRKINLLVDPWISGKAFNNGWSLLTDSYFPEKIAKTITHIWISHEHPDHFSVKDLIQLKKINKNDIKVIFQKTKDNRVYNFLKKIGYEVHVLDDYEEYKLSEKFKIQIIKTGQINSLSLVTVQNKFILNTNDCDLEKNFLKFLKKKLNLIRCDILLTQFSYAYWHSKPSEKFKREIASQEKLNSMKTQIEMFNPKFTIPFASYIYFCHSENKYMNDSITNLNKVKEMIENLNSKPIFLYPASEYKLDKEFNSSIDNLNKYIKDFNSLEKRYYLKSPKINFEDLKISSKKYLEGLYKKNSKFFMFLFCYISKFLKLFFNKDFLGFSGSIIHLTDLSITISFDWVKGIKILKKKPADIFISSDSLNYIFNYQWGFGSLMINGRGDYRNEHSKWLFNRIFILGSLNSVGETLLSRTFKKIIKTISTLNVESSFIEKNN